MRSKIIFGMCLATVIAISGCSTLTLDIGEGRRAEQRGDFELAARHFKGLADKGYPAAMIEYGDLLKSSRKAKDFKLAEHWYGEAAKFGGNYEVRANERLAKLYYSVAENDDYDANEEEAFKAEKYLYKNFPFDPFGSYVSLANLYLKHWYTGEPPQQRLDALNAHMESRGVVYQEFSRAAMANVRRQDPNYVLNVCQKIARMVKECYLENVKAAKRLDKQTVTQQLDEVLVQHKKGVLENRDVLEISRELYREPPFYPREAERILVKLYAQDKAYAYELAKLYYYNEMPAKKGKIIELLEVAAGNFDPRANYLLGRMYLDGDWVLIDPKRAAELFEQSREEVANAELLLGKIYYDGLLGRAYPQKAFEYFISAARRGVVNGDYELAKMFWACQGNICNKAYAVSFITLARERSSAEKVVNLYNDIMNNAEAAYKQKGRELANIEKSARVEEPTLITSN
ncbi:Alginate biosynthesis protein AlgK [Thalassocella blandensis]|nr:Alginate biosynthesis protein AlgK [Thalassocella blandensis]